MKWDGYPLEEATWEPYKNLIKDNALNLVQAFETRLKNCKSVNDQPEITNYIKKKVKLVDEKQNSSSSESPSSSKSENILF